LEVREDEFATSEGTRTTLMVAWLLPDIAFLTHKRIGATVSLLIEFATLASASGKVTNERQGMSARFSGG
jgi:hypothetical protein